MKLFLILIGDHKQLRPSTAVYKLAKEFHLDISLFERMVNSDVPYYALGEQHRMRPEVSSLITPAIYPNLIDHISVLNRPHIRGVTKDIFFINHTNFETEVGNLHFYCLTCELKHIICYILLLPIK